MGSFLGLKTGGRSQSGLLREVSTGKTHQVDKWVRGQGMMPTTWWGLECRSGTLGTDATVAQDEGHRGHHWLKTGSLL